MIIFCVICAFSFDDDAIIFNVDVKIILFITIVQCHALHTNTLTVINSSIVLKMITAFERQRIQ